MIKLIKEFSAFRSAKNATMKEAEWWRQQMFAAPSASGVTVNESNALSITAVYRCINILSETIAGLPVSVHKKTQYGFEKVEHPLNYVLSHQANKNNTALEHTQFQVGSLNLYGNSYSQKILSNRGAVGELVPLQPELISLDTDLSGSLVFDYQSPGESRSFYAKDLWRVMGISRDGIQGLSPIALAKENLGISAAAELSAASMYANGLRSEIAITVPAGLSDEAFERLRKDIREKHQGASNTSNPLLLEGEGAKAQVLNMSAQDAQFLESRKFSELQVAMMFGVPPHKLGILDRATFSNINEQSLSFVTDTIQPANARLETSAWRDLLSDAEKRAGYVIKYDTDGLIKSDLASRMEGYQKSVGGPIQTVNEARQKEGLPPVDGGDVLLQPLNMGGSTEQPENNANVLNYLAKREVRDTKKDKNPTEWAEKFYTKHAELLVEDFGVTQDNAVAYAAKRIKQVLAGETLNIDQVKTDLGQIL